MDKDCVNHVQDMKVWLEGGPININKGIICRLIEYPTLDRPKSIRCIARNEVDKSTKEQWNSRGMSIDWIEDHGIKFVVIVIAHNFNQSS